MSLSCGGDPSRRAAPGCGGGGPWPRAAAPPAPRAAEGCWQLSLEETGYQHERGGVRVRLGGQSEPPGGVLGGAALWRRCVAAQPSLPRPSAAYSHWRRRGWVLGAGSRLAAAPG